MKHCLWSIIASHPAQISAAVALGWLANAPSAIAQNVRLLDVLETNLSEPEVFTPERRSFSERILSVTPPTTIPLSPIAASSHAPSSLPDDAIAQSNGMEQLEQRLLELETRQQELEQEIDRLRQELDAAQQELDTAQEDETVPVDAIVADELDDIQRAEFSAEVLFFTPNTTGIQDFAIVDNGSSNAFVIDGDVAAVDYNDETGYRLSVNYQFLNSPIDVELSYSALEANAFEQVTRPDRGILLATLSNPSQNESADTASAEADLNYRVVDLTVGHQFDVGDRLDIRLFSGLRFANIDQDLDVRYDGDDFSNTRIQLNRDFVGYGLRIGSEANLDLGAGLSLFSRIGGSLLVGEFSGEQIETDDRGRDLIAQIEQEQNQEIVPVLDLLAGLNWTMSVSRSTQLSFTVGYELQNWFNVSETTRFVDNSGQGVLTRDTGDLSFSGLFLEGGVLIEF
jgi:hypothetical protein